MLEYRMIPSFSEKPLNQYPHERVGIAILPQRTLAVQRFIHAKRLRYVNGENATLSSCHSDCQKEAGRGKKKIKGATHKFMSFVWTSLKYHPCSPTLHEI